MLNFFLRLFALVGALATLLVVVGITVLLRDQYAVPSEPQNVVLTLDFDRPIVERPASSPLKVAMESDSIPLLDILHAIDSARADPHVKGMVARFGSTEPPLADVEEIRAAIARFRASGKFTYAFGTTYGDFGTGNRAYFLASAFQDIWLQPVGTVGLTGLAIETPYAKSALAKIGVGADFMQRKEYKSVMETFTRDDMSDPVRANMQSLIDDLARQEADGIAETRKWTPAQVSQLMATGPFTADEALKAGLVTHIGYADQLEQEIKKQAGKGARLLGAEDYLGRLPPKRPAAKPATQVALIYGTGLITSHGVGSDGLAGGDVMGADTVAGAFDAAARDKKIKAIIFRIDSPGGSPVASETIRRAVIHAEDKGKPVFVTMGGEAASGGYWIAMNANEIVAEPGTLTGSIGVVGGKFLLGGLMQKLGVSWGMVSTGGNTGMWSMLADYTPEEKARVNALLDATYAAFTQNVAAARKIPLAKMPDIAKGRVWTGAQAQKLGLVDQLGGYGVALADMRKKLGLKPGQIVELKLFPAPLTPSEKIMLILKKIGLESLALDATLGKWQHVESELGPFVGALGGTGAVQTRMPGVVLQ